MKSKSLTLSQTLEALRCIIAADRESNRLRERMRMWHRTYLSQKRKEKRRGAQWDVNHVINVSGSGDFLLLFSFTSDISFVIYWQEKNSKYICYTLIKVWTQKWNYVKKTRLISTKCPLLLVYQYFVCSLSRVVCEQEQRQCLNKMCCNSYESIS